MIRRAAAADLDAICAIYSEIFAHERETERFTQWIEGVYPTRETAGRLLDDYRELCRMTDNAIARQKEIANVPLLRLIDGLSAAFSPERLRQISEELGRLREEQGTRAGDAAPDEGAPERKEGDA